MVDTDDRREQIRSMLDRLHAARADHQIRDEGHMLWRCGWASNEMVADWLARAEAACRLAGVRRW